MKKYKKILSIIFALVVIIGSISFSGIAFSEEAEDTKVVELINEQSEEVDENDDSGKSALDNDDGEVGDGEVDDGEPDDGEPDDGEPDDGEPVDGEPVDGEPVDGEIDDGEEGVLVQSALQAKVKIEEITNIMTTDRDNVPVNKNVDYNDISEVYVRIEGHKEEGPYRLKFFVYGPGNNDLISDEDPNSYIIENGEYPQLISMTTVDATKNPGGVYRVVVEQYDEDGEFITSKSDNFKVKKSTKEDKYGKVKIIKHISEDVPTVTSMAVEDLSGFEFELWQGGEKKYGPVVTNPDGEALFENVLLGKYDIIENLTKNQKKLYEDPNPEDVDVSEENRVYEVEFTNHRKYVPEWNKGKLIVTKFRWGLPGKWNIRLPEDPRNITFTLKGENIEEMEATTNKFGIATFDNLPEGNYILEEIVPEGYESSLPEDGREIDINKNRLFGIVAVKVNNYKLPDKPEEPWEGSIRIIKSMHSDELSPEGFKFELFKDEESASEVLTTNGYGEVQFNGLKAGIYEVREVDNEEYEPEYPNGRFVEIGPGLNEETDYIAMVEVINHPIDNPPEQWKGRIDVEKIVRDPRSNNPSLAGFEFELYKVEDGKEILKETITTDSSGKISFKGLEEGIYKLYESDRAWFIEGIDSSGRQIILSPNTAPEGVLEISVTNTRYYPEDPDEPEEPERPRISVDPEEPEEPVVVEEPIPEAQPEAEEPLEEVEEIEEVEEEVPEAKPILPKTGAVNPLAYSGLGTALLGLGLYLKKKEE